jgi:hypothetical protein
MGVEPTGARCSQPPTDFEDRGTHRGTSTPTLSQQDNAKALDGQAKSGTLPLSSALSPHLKPYPPQSVLKLCFPLAPLIP